MIAVKGIMIPIPSDNLRPALLGTYLRIVSKIFTDSIPCVLNKKFNFCTLIALPPARKTGFLTS